MYAERHFQRRLVNIWVLYPHNRYLSTITLDVIGTILYRHTTIDFKSFKYCLLPSERSASRLLLRSFSHDWLISTKLGRFFNIPTTAACGAYYINFALISFYSNNLVSLIRFRSLFRKSLYNGNSNALCILTLCWLTVH